MILLYMMNSFYSIFIVKVNTSKNVLLRKEENMAIMKVRYNGGTMHYYSCSPPDNLICGKVYNVVSKITLDCQTNYILEGIEGEYNSAWFDKVTEPKLYMATSDMIPLTGEMFFCYLLNDVQNGLAHQVPWLTDEVLGIRYCGNNIYIVNTCNEILVVMVS